MGLFLLFATSGLAQQRVQFTQYMFNGLVINPAYAGVDEKLNVTLISRDQWTGIDGAPKTQTLSAHTLLKKKQFGLGFTLVNDQVGVHREVDASVCYAYHVRVGEESYLSMGYQTGIKSLRSDYASLTTSNSTDPYLFNLVTKQLFLDMAAGVYYRNPRLQVGFSIPEMLRQKFHVNDTLSVHLNTSNFFLFTRYRLTVNQDIAFEPSFLIKYLNGVPLSFDINANWVYRGAVTMGLSYRKNESADFLFKAQVSQQLQIGYAYDYPIKTGTAMNAGGSHELMLQYLFTFFKKNVRSPR
ncbi:MAG TPA: type IX secretion system membrane protein PorP/SprF [Cyclobacteriaceae bacterium]|nr:type IX secretion system membrane protein PorP/SprF [Cyclobacteriaceae bacterium]